jgi:hypothetical protein
MRQLDLAPGKDFLQSAEPESAPPPQLGLGEDRPASDRGGQADLDRPLGIETPEGSAHQRPALVVAESLLVGLGSQAVQAEVGAVELAKGPRLALPSMLLFPWPAIRATLMPERNV